MIPSALDHLDEIVPAPGKRLALFLDYDGTLTPIVGRPEQAVLANSTRQTLRLLAKRLPVAILSGRDLDDIRWRVNIEGIVYAGSHGFDIVGPRRLRRQVAVEFLPVLDVAEKELREKLAGIPGAFLERKGFSIAAHYRQADANGTIKVKQSVDEVAELHSELRVITGKKVRELLPDIDWHKGKTLMWLLETLGLPQSKVIPLYIGDDTTDEDAFRTIGERGTGIIISKQPRRTAARYALKSPSEVERFLQQLAARLPSGAKFTV